MKNKKIVKVLIIVISIIILFGIAENILFCFMCSMTTTIDYINEADNSNKISNVHCTGCDGKLPWINYGYYKVNNDNHGEYIVRHAAVYDYYFYTFDVEVNGKTITPEIGIFKTNTWDVNSNSIRMVVYQVGDTYTAEITVWGDTTIIEDIENNKISIKTGA